MGRIYTTSIRGEKIELPRELIIFYKQRGIFNPYLPSYEDVKGEGAQEPPNAFFDKHGDPSVLSAIIENEEREQGVRALRKAKRVGKHLLGEKHLPSIGVVSRAYMLNGGTKPIRLEFIVGGRRRTVYVKKPELSRVLGKDLYNHLSGDRLDFRFNEYGFAVMEARGRLLTQENKKYFVNDEKFMEGLIRLSVLDDFISINDLSSQGSQRNILVDEKCNIRVIDFNCLFLPSPGALSVFGYYRGYFGVNFPDGLIEGVTKDEKIKIKRRFVRHKKYLERLIRMMSRVPQLNKRIRDFHGDESIDHYFKRRLAELK